MRVTATAGSGKTQLALAVLTTAVAAGRRPLYVCCNRPLAGHKVHHPAVTEVNTLVVGYRAAALAFEVQQRRVVGGAGVGRQLCGGGVEHLDRVFQLVQKKCGFAAYKLRNAVAGKQPAAVGGGIRAANQPFFIANDNARAWRKWKHVVSFLFQAFGKRKILAYNDMLHFA